MTRNYVVLPIILISLIMAGCYKEKQDNQSNNENENIIETSVENDTNDDATDKKLEESVEVKLEAPTLPVTIEQVVNYPIGKFSSKSLDYKTAEVELDLFPALSESVSEEEIVSYFTYIYSLFKVDYPDPSTIIQSFDQNSQTDNDIPTELKQVEQHNVEVILDSSGSMANKIGSKTRMDLAKESIQNFTSALTENANVALRVYGHKGTGSDQDKSMSCDARELVYPLQPYEESKFKQSLDSFQPSGWTPLAQSMLDAMNDFMTIEASNSRNIIYIVSDGIETCDGDPVQAAKSLKDSGLSPIVNIIGFDVDSKGQAQLKEVAEAAGGTYVNVQNQDQLNDEFKRSIEEYHKWRIWKLKTNNDALTFFHEQKIEIYKNANSWRNVIPVESNNIQRAITYLKYKDLISNEQAEKMQQLRSDHYKIQRKNIDNFVSTLEQINEDNYEENIQNIENMFKQNTANP